MTDTGNENTNRLGAGLYQKETKKLLEAIFAAGNVKSEWSVRTRATDTFKKSNRSVYAPRLDLAVGPFNSSIENVHQDLDRIIEASQHTLVQKIVREAATQNSSHFQVNRNPRCLLAIEIEWGGSSKHILGDYTNASMMGFIGIIIGFEKSITKIQRVGTYAKELQRLQKAPPDLFANVACFTADEFTNLLRPSQR